MVVLLLRLLILGVALLVGVVLHGMVQAHVANRFGDRQPVAAGRGTPDPRRHFEPFGVIAMLIAGLGWGRPVPFTEPRFRGARMRFTLAVLAGPAANLLLAIAALVAQVPLGGTSGNPYGTGGVPGVLGVFARVNVALAVLTLIPLPPLDGARLLWVHGPQSAGWRQARYQLEERNIGLAICLVLALPIFGTSGLLVRIVYAIAGPLLETLRTLVGV